MAIVAVKLPDVGEGVAEAELVEWNVKVGDFVREDAILAAVMTDKATVEIPSPVEGKVVWTGGEVGQQLAVGSVLVKLDNEGAEGEAAPADVTDAPSQPAPGNAVPLTPNSTEPKRGEGEPKGDESGASASTTSERVEKPLRPLASSPRVASSKPLASPSVRQRARTMGIELSFVAGSGPAGRITHDDLDSYRVGRNLAPSAGATKAEDTVHETRLIGLRRKIAERMAEAKRRVPHITIVEEVDVTSLEALREQLNAQRRPDRPKLTVLPFLMSAIARAVREQPMMNAHFVDDSEIFREFNAVHIGIATQTPSGLMVPVVRHCEARSIWDAAAELSRISEAARSGKASREELSGSTITISSLGPLGAIATTPIINRPEVAIVGVNRMEIRPHWDGSQFVPRKMMNLSSSFDHRVIDGWDAAVFVKRLKSLLEAPALIFIEQ